MKKKKREEGFFRKHYSLSWKYIKESSVYILLMICLLLFGAFAALLYQPPLLVEAIKAFMESILKDTSNFNVFEMMVYILNNNLKNSFFAMIFGVIFGIMPIFTALSNGYVLGFVAEKSVLVAGPSVLLRLLPHGIFEFPAIILALATGIRLGLFWFSDNKKKEFVKRVEGSLRVFLFVILPLLIIAAIIEGFLIFALE
ncbi:hypothetical protein A3K73_06150 [Candidatus Pacearchaeota archaeon RBG_13_36_9]|nr:MAG: hypothetical protein A3K73_06150 [Candidatus Pacearchaeota archaeon RBG_13_36_9]